MIQPPPPPFYRALSTKSSSSLATSFLKAATSFQQSSGRRSLAPRHSTTASLAFLTAGSSSRTFLRPSSRALNAPISSFSAGLVKSPLPAPSAEDEPSRGMGVVSGKPRGAEAAAAAAAAAAWADADELICCSTSRSLFASCSSSLRSSSVTRDWITFSSAFSRVESLWSQRQPRTSVTLGLAAMIYDTAIKQPEDGEARTSGLACNEFIICGEKRTGDSLVASVSLDNPTVCRIQRGGRKEQGACRSIRRNAPQLSTSFFRMPNSRHVVQALEERRREHQRMAARSTYETESIYLVKTYCELCPDAGFEADDPMAGGRVWIDCRPLLQWLGSSQTFLAPLSPSRSFPQKLPEATTAPHTAHSSQLTAHSSQLTAHSCPLPSPRPFAALRSRKQRQRQQQQPTRIVMRRLPGARRARQLLPKRVGP